VGQTPQWRLQELSSGPSSSALIESTEPTWLQARGRSISKRAGGLMPSRNMPANWSSPGPSLARAVGRCDNPREVRRKRYPGPGI